MSFTIPILMISYSITIVSAIISYHIFGQASKIKRRLYHLLAALIKHKFIRQYFSLAYRFYIWLFCVGENTSLRFRFNIIISFLEIVTVCSLFFRSLILFLGCYINNLTLILITILFALNGLFRVFLKSGLLINNIDNNHFLQTESNGGPGDDENIIIPWGQEVSGSGNEYVKRNANVFNSFPPNFDPEKSNPKSNNELKKHTMNHSQDRYSNGQRWMIGITFASAILSVVVPNFIEYRRQKYETKVRLEQQEYKTSQNEKKNAVDLRLAEQKTQRAGFKAETAKANAEIAKANADTAKANADTAKANADTTRYEAKLAKQNRLSMESQKKTNDSSVINQIKNSWNRKP